jgi:hypothetical protein
MLRSVHARLDAAPGLRGDASEAGDARPGCLMVNTAIEVARRDERARVAVARSHDELRAAIGHLVDQTIEAGEANGHVDRVLATDQIFTQTSFIGYGAIISASERTRTCRATSQPDHHRGRAHQPVRRRHRPLAPQPRPTRRLAEPHPVVTAFPHLASATATWRPSPGCSASASMLPRKGVR